MRPLYKRYSLRYSVVVSTLHTSIEIYRVFPSFSNAMDKEKLLGNKISNPGHIPKYKRVFIDNLANSMFADCIETIFVG